MKLTLVTGDTVTVGRGPRGIASYRITPGEGRGHITFLTRSKGEGQLSVIPSDTAALLAADRLDPALFDLNALLDNGSGGTPAVLVQHSRGADRADRAKTALGTGAKVVRALPRLGVSAVRAERPARMWKAITGAAAEARSLRGGVTKIWLDRTLRITLDQSVPQIRAPQAWAAGYTGEGVTVAVLDTGYDSDHPDLAGVVTSSADFTSSGGPGDEVGHGTHVAATIAGQNAPYKGVAPGVKLAVGKVCTVGGCPESAILAGMEWAARTAGAKVINMSLGHPDEPGVDPLEQAVNDLSQETGALFTISAGNSHCRFGGSTVGSPGTADAALSVGAVYRDDSVTDFSSCGPRRDDQVMKPDIMAPGAGIVAAFPGGGHRALSGTSMAAPHVAGAAALLAQRHPDWDGRRLKAALMSTAHAGTQNVPSDRYGLGRVDAEAAVTAAVTPGIASVHLVQPWPRPQEAPTRTVTYSNTGASTVSLRLATTTTPGSVTLSADRLEVPAGGSAEVTLTYRSAGSAERRELGLLTATDAGGTVVAKTALALYEEARYNVEVSLLDRRGEPASASVAAVDGTTGEVTWAAFKAGRGRLLLPAGTHYLATTIYPATPDDLTYTAAVQKVTVTEPDAVTSATIDARAGRQVELTVDENAARPVARSLSLSVRVGGRMALSEGGNLSGDSRWAVVPLQDAGVGYSARAVFDKDGSGDDAPTPYVYRVADVRTGVPADPRRAFTKAELTKVNVVYRSQAAPAAGTAEVGMVSEGLPTLMHTFPVALPSTVTEYRSPGVYSAGLRFGGHWLVAHDREYGPGRDDTEVWNGAVSGPLLEGATGARRLDFMSIPNISWFTDAGPRRWASTPVAGTMTLSRGGQQLAQWSAGVYGYVDALPTARETYTLTAAVTRDAADAALATRIDTTWRFTSEGTSEYVDNPLFVPRLTALGLDEANRAAGGSRTEVLLGHSGTPSGAVSATGAEVSLDDGATWSPLTITPAPGVLGRVTIANPAAEGHVSLRVSLADAAGNTVVHAVRRAYRVRAATGATTVVRVHYDAGWGNRITLRGDTAPLRWDTGQECVGKAAGLWECEIHGIPAGQGFRFKPLINDTRWSIGADHTGTGGQSIDITPRF
ncbi:S8 family serine peptidase [Planobispora siamensis]|uniref:S8 family serine peptidase n=1 Tax=Planobispora siamensis TaxID=936338 RepID=UPI00194DEB48|nr:S8 family serine peptidase [Planobispora siamensis]